MVGEPLSHDGNNNNMPNKRYVTGRNVEYKLKKDLEADDWLVLRSAGSKGPFDLVAVRYDQPVRFIQVKSTQSKKANHEIIQFIQRLPLNARGPYRQEIWVWQYDIRQWRSRSM